MGIFSDSLSKEKKEKDRQKKIDNMLKIYDKINNQNEKKYGSKMEGISFSKKWLNNRYADNLLKCLSPTIALVGIGTIFWGSGFVVQEISKSSEFLKGLSLPGKITDIITTFSFWRIVGIVALAGVVSFLFLTIFKTIKNTIKEYREYKRNTAYRNLTQQRYKQYEKYKPISYSSCCHENNKIIKNQQNRSINKYNYDNSLKYKNIYNATRRPKNININLCKNIKNKQNSLHENYKKLNTLKKNKRIYSNFFKSKYL